MFKTYVFKNLVSYSRCEEEQKQSIESIEVVKGRKIEQLDKCWDVTVKRSGGRYRRKCEEKRLVWEQGRRWKVCAKVLEKAENWQWFCGALEWSAGRQGGHGRERQMSCSVVALTVLIPAKPLSPPLVNEKFSEAWEESDWFDSLSGHKKKSGCRLCSLCLLLLPESYKKA